MMNKKLYIFYMHINKINNKRYIGSTTQTLKSRWKNGKGYKFNKEFNDDINKYGVESFEHIELLKTYCTVEEAAKIEKNFIIQYKPEYNKKVSGIKDISPNATKAMQKFMEKNPEWCKNKVKDCLKWQKDNPEKFKENNKKFQEKGTEAVKRKVQCIETQKIYNSIAEAVLDTGCLQSKITECCRGTRNTTHNLHWRYINDNK